MTDAIVVPEQFRYMRIAAAIARDQLFNDDGSSRLRLSQNWGGIMRWWSAFQKYGALLDERVVFSSWTPTHSLIVVDEWPENLIRFPMGGGNGSVN